MIPTYGYARGGQGSIATYGYGKSLIVEIIGAVRSFVRSCVPLRVFRESC